MRRSDRVRPSPARMRSKAQVFDLRKAGLEVSSKRAFSIETAVELSTRMERITGMEFWCDAKVNVEARSTAMVTFPSCPRGASSADWISLISRSKIKVANSGIPILRPCSQEPFYFKYLRNNHTSH